MSIHLKFAENNITDMAQINKLSENAAKELLSSFWVEDLNDLKLSNLLKLGFSEKELSGSFIPFFKYLNSHLILIESNSYAKEFPSCEKYGYMLFNAKMDGIELLNVIAKIESLRDSSLAPFFIEIFIRNITKKVEPFMKFEKILEDGKWRDIFISRENIIATDEYEFSWKIKTDYGKVLKIKY